MKKHEIFISYRRDGAEDYARAVYEDLKHKGFSVFLDRQDLMSGDYEAQVMKTIENCRDVIIILPKGALDRCQNEDDLFRKEIAKAMSCKKNIITIARQGFKIPEEEELPEDMKGFSKLEAIFETPNAYEGVLKRLETMLKNSRKQASKKHTRKLLPIIAGGAALLLLAAAVIVFNVLLSKPALKNKYQYPREVSGRYYSYYEDSGKLLGVFLGMNVEKTHERLGYSGTAVNDRGCDMYSFLIKGDVTSVPGYTVTEELGSDSKYGSYNAMAACYFYNNILEYYTLVLPSSDKRAAKKVMKNLYKEYNNGSGKEYENAYVISDVKELGGSLLIEYGTNLSGNDCIFINVYDNSLRTDWREDIKATGSLTVSDYEGIEFGTYSYDGVLKSKSIITSAEAEFNSFSTVRVTINGKKTFSANGDNSLSSVEFQLRLIDENGNVVYDGEYRSPDIKVGETFKGSVSLNLSSGSTDDDYTIEISEVKEGY